MTGRATELVVPVELGDDWARRHARGEVPGRWPYGLEQLEESISGIRLAPLETPDRLQRATARVLPNRRGAEQRRGLAWDENTAHRMVCSRRYGEMHCGVIWANDRWGPQSQPAPAGVLRTLARMDSVWTLSRGQLDRFDGLLPASTTRHFVPFGIDEQFYGYRPYPTKPLILSAGSDRDRDHETLMRAFALVVAARPGVDAVVQSGRAVAADPGVRVVPRLTHRELLELYARASVVAVATRPNLHVSGMTVCLEAQSTGRPVVLTGTPGADDYVAEGVTGFLTGVGDAPEMADRIVDLLDDPNRAEALGRSAREAVVQQFTTGHLSNRLAQLVTAPSA